MNDKQLSALLRMVKIDLGITTGAYDERLSQFIRASEKFITEEGADLDFTDIQDQHLIAMYAEWLWRRRDTGEGMPRMLRYALNNRVLSRKMREPDG